MQKILILSFYFKPDLSAGSFRTTSLVEALKSKLPQDAKIHVITTMPNRYHSHTIEANETDLDDMVEITRIPIPPHKNDMLGQMRAFFVYFKAVIKIIRKQKYTLVYATSSRLFTAFLGAICARQQKAPLYLDIRDIFVDTCRDVFTDKNIKYLLPFLSRIEKYTLSSATRINLVSPGFLDYFHNLFPAKQFDFYTNGIDKVFLEATPHPEHREGSPDSFSNSKKIILYAGNIGEGQGLEKIVPELALACVKEFDFIIIGDGGRRNALEDALQINQVSNVRILDPLDRNELINYYQKADVLFLHLNDYEAFCKVLPSKVFEYAASGKPILAGVGGYAKTFIKSEINNAAVFSPCNCQQALAALATLKYESVVRSDFIEKYNRESIMDKLSSSVLSLG